MTAIYLAQARTGQERRTWARWDWAAHPVKFLVAYPYAAGYQADARKLGYRPARTMLDSGAYTAWQSGGRVSIDLAALCEESKKPQWDEAVALDVIGRPTESLVNAMWMRLHGSPAFPVFHYGEPWEYLAEYCRQFPKVGLSCRLGEPLPASMRWLEGCFGRGWPHPFHSFGWVNGPVLERFPFASADTASWAQDLVRYGKSRAMPGVPVARGSADLAAEVHWYLRLERKLRALWGKELAGFEQQRGRGAGTLPNGDGNRPTGPGAPDRADGRDPDGRRHGQGGHGQGHGPGGGAGVAAALSGQALAPAHG